MVAMAATTLLMPCVVHRLVRAQIALELLLYLNAQSDLNLKCLIGSGVEVGESDISVPDIAVVTRNRPPTEDRILRGAPELAIEVVSSETAVHLKRKVDGYREGGSKTVWVVYPESESIEVYRADMIQTLKASQAVTDPLLPGFSAPVASFFELT